MAILMWQNIFVTNLRQSTKLDYLQKFCERKVRSLSEFLLLLLSFFFIVAVTSHTHTQTICKLNIFLQDWSYCLESDAFNINIQTFRPHNCEMYSLSLSYYFILFNFYFCYFATYCCMPSRTVLYVYSWSTEWCWFCWYCCCGCCYFFYFGRHSHLILFDTKSPKSTLNQNCKLWTFVALSLMLDFCDVNYGVIAFTKWSVMEREENDCE